MQKRTRQGNISSDIGATDEVELVSSSPCTYGGIF